MSVELDALPVPVMVSGHWRDALHLLRESVRSKLRPSSPLRNSVLNVQSSDAPCTGGTCCEYSMAEAEETEVWKDSERW